MLSKRFPFGIYYEVEDEVVYVYAILDLRRDPLWFRKQLRERGRLLPSAVGTQVSLFRRSGFSGALTIRALPVEHIHPTHHPNSNP
jgi:hypothetical protein